MADPVRKPPLMSPGDNIGYSVSQEIPTKRSTTWVKCEGSTTIRAGETTNQAKARLVQFVNDWISGQISDLMDG